MARVLIVEEALKNRSGHWYEYNRAIVEEARKRGHEVILLAHKDIESDICEELEATPYFPVTSWDQVYNYPQTWKRYLGILRHNISIARLLQKHFKTQSDPYDVVLVPTVVLYHWLAWRWLVFCGAGKWFGRVVLTTRNNAGEYDPESRSYTFNASARVLARVLKSFRHSVGSGVVEFASDSSVLCRQYEELCGLSFHPYPHPRPTDHLPLPQNDSKGEMVFSALGPPRYEKGSDLIVAAIQTIFEENPNFAGRFVLQWTSKVYAPNGTEVNLPTEWQENPKIEIIRNSLSSEDYQQRIEESDVILLPYRRAQYHARLSGIVIEAFQSGVPCICVSDTWLSDCMTKIGKGVAITEESASCLLESISKFFNKEAGNMTMTTSEVTQARRHHSPEAFINQLLTVE